jgi:hemerythrin-like domain-containing protein
MISPADDCFAYANYLEAEHRRLRQFVRSVQEAFTASLELTADRPGSRHRALIDRLSELHQQLDRHFEQEEQGGCIEEAVSRRPALASVAR